MENKMYLVEGLPCVAHLYNCNSMQLVVIFQVAHSYLKQEPQRTQKEKKEETFSVISVKDSGNFSVVNIIINYNLPLK